MCVAGIPSPLTPPQRGFAQESLTLTAILCSLRSYCAGRPADESGMPIFTCITEIRDSTHPTQHTADRPEAALRSHVASLPYDDGSGPFDDELEWLLRVSDGTEPVE